MTEMEEKVAINLMEEETTPLKFTDRTIVGGGDTDKAYQNGYEDGYAKAYQVGYRHGYDAGCRDGYDTALAGTPSRGENAPN